MGLYKGAVGAVQEDGQRLKMMLLLLLEVVEAATSQVVTSVRIDQRNYHDDCL